MVEAEEHRKTQRRRTLKGAWILFNDGRSTISCIVRDLSEEGARLCVTSVIGIPSKFVLHVDDLRRPCRVVRTMATELGVRFEPSEPARGDEERKRDGDS